MFFSHITLASIDHRPQEVTLEDMMFILGLVERSKDFRFIFNAWGAAASINHLHFQATDNQFCIERAAEELVFEKGGLVINQLTKNWPNVVYVAYGEHEKIAEFVMNMIQAMPKPVFNLVINRDENGKAKVYFIPRTKEKPSYFDNNFSFAEMSGTFVIEKTVDFNKVTEENLAAAMAECGYPWDAQAEAQEILERALGAVVGMRGNQLILYSGPSAVGKSPLWEQINLRYPDYFNRIVLYTSRSPRPGEVDGVDYYFRTVDEIIQLAENNPGTFVTMSVHKDLQGVDLRDVEKAIRGGKIAIAEVSVDWAAKLRKQYPDIVFTIFISPLSDGELQLRRRQQHQSAATVIYREMIKRQNERAREKPTAKDKRQTRAINAVEEMSRMGEYNAVIINSRLRDLARDKERWEGCDGQKIVSQFMDLVVEATGMAFAPRFLGTVAAGDSSIKEAIAAVDAAEACVEQEITAFDQQISEKQESFLSRFYHAVKRTFGGIREKVAQGRQDPFVQARLSPSEPLDNRLHSIDREARIALLSAAGNPFNRGHKLIMLMAINALELDMAVIRVQGQISYKNLLACERVPIEERHLMVRESIKGLYPLLRYTDLGSEKEADGSDNCREGAEEMHRLLAMNADRKLHIYYLIGAENEERMWKYMRQQYEMSARFGVRPNHKITFAVIQRGEYGRTVTITDLQAISAAIQREPGAAWMLDVVLVQDPDIDLNVSSTYYRNTQDGAFVPLFVHKFSQAHGYYGHPVIDPETGMPVAADKEEYFRQRLRPVAEEIAEDVREYLERNLGGSGPVIISIDGGSGSGKTTIAEEVANYLQAQGIITIIVGLDMFLKDRKWRMAIQKLVTGRQLSREEQGLVGALLQTINPREEYRQEETFFDNAAISQALLEIISSIEFSGIKKEVLIENAYDQKTKQSGPKTVCINSRTTVLIIEGKYANNEELQQLYHLRYRLHDAPDRTKARFEIRSRTLSPEDADMQIVFYDYALEPSYEAYDQRTAGIIHGFINLRGEDWFVERPKVDYGRIEERWSDIRHTGNSDTVLISVDFYFNNLHIGTAELAINPECVRIETWHSRCYIRHSRDLEKELFARAYLRGSQISQWLSIGSRYAYATYILTPEEWAFVESSANNWSQMEELRENRLFSALQDLGMTKVGYFDVHNLPLESASLINYYGLLEEIIVRLQQRWAEPELADNLAANEAVLKSIVAKYNLNRLQQKFLKDLTDLIEDYLEANHQGRDIAVRPIVLLHNGRLDAAEYGRFCEVYSGLEAQEKAALSAQIRQIALPLCNALAEAGCLMPEYPAPVDKGPTILAAATGACIDLVLYLEDIDGDGSLDLKAVKINPGGTPTNTAQALVFAGKNIIALATVGNEHSGEIYCNLMGAEGVDCSNFVQAGGYTKINILAMVAAGGSRHQEQKEYRIISPGQEFTIEEQETYLDRIDQLCNENPSVRYLTTGGGTPANAPDYIAQIIRRAKAKGLIVVLDVKEYAIDTPEKRGILFGAQPDVVKPNLKEFAIICGIREEELQAADGELDYQLIVTKAKEFLAEYGIEVLLLSLGGQGAVLVTPELALKSAAVPVEVLGPFGAGDTMVAYFTAFLPQDAKSIQDITHEQLKEAFRWSMYGSAATVALPGTDIATLKDAQGLAERFPDWPMEAIPPVSKLQHFNLDVPADFSYRGPCVRAQFSVKNS
ncbi:MAG: PfkB family carbohydrate kinase [Dehalococcoidales bacterium]|nr:PfkB family carbohydrate kinase [Dehalococcoidales bacterium]